MAGMIGVFGGTFDPPHFGHLILAEEGRLALGLEKVLWVVTALPPHKPEEPVTPIAARLAMVRAAIDGNPAFELSLADVDRPVPHYSVGTLSWLAERNPAAQFAYLMGADSLRDLPSWHTPRELVSACTWIGVMRRPGVEIDLQGLEVRVPGVQAKVRFFDAPEVNLSAHEIRRRIREGKSCRYLVPAGVAQVIEREGLYRD